LYLKNTIKLPPPKGGGLVQLLNKQYCVVYGFAVLYRNGVYLSFIVIKGVFNMLIWDVLLTDW